MPDHGQSPASATDARAPDRADVLLHIGYHKTGTTWLQQNVFSREEFGFATPFRKSREVRECLVRPNALDFDPAQVRAQFLPAFEALNRRGLVGVITAERLSGNPHFGGRDSRELADRLAMLFPQASVCIGIREQASMIRSCYQQYVRMGGGLDLANYLRMSEATRSGAAVFSFDHFRYDRLIAYYRKVFGDDRVLVLPHELLRRQPDAYVRALAGFCGTDPDIRPDFSAEENRAPAEMAIAVKRLLNPLTEQDRLFAQNNRPLARLTGLTLRTVILVDRLAPKSLNRRLRQRWQATLRQVMEDTGVDYADSNARTQGFCAFDLGELGYRIATA